MTQLSTDEIKDPVKRYSLQQNKIKLSSMCSNSFVVSIKNLIFEMFCANACLYILK